MKCELELCIYNEEKNCVLNVVRIDAAGCCADCVLVSLEKETLYKYKKRLLKKLSQEDNEQA